MLPFSYCRLPEELSHGDAIVINHWHNELCKVEPKMRYIYGHVLCILQDLFHPARTEDRVIKFPLKTLKTCTILVKPCHVACSPFVVLLCGQCPCLDKVVQQNSHAFSSNCAVFKGQLNAISYKYV